MRFWIRQLMEMTGNGHRLTTMTKPNTKQMADEAGALLCSFTVFGLAPVITGSPAMSSWNLME